MLESFETAAPALLLVIVCTNIMVLWTINNINQRLRIAEDHLESVRRQQDEVDESISLLAKRGLEDGEAPRPG